MNEKYSAQLSPLAAMQPDRYKPIPYLERLKSRKHGLEEDLARVNEAINAMEANPEVTKLLDLVQATL